MQVQTLASHLFARDQRNLHAQSSFRLHPSVHRPLIRIEIASARQLFVIVDSLSDRLAEHSNTISTKQSALLWIISRDQNQAETFSGADTVTIEDDVRNDVLALSPPVH